MDAGAQGKESPMRELISPHLISSLRPALTLALKAMSLRIISRVKRTVKATLRMSEMWFISSDWL